MRNKYKGICYKCGKLVDVGDGFIQCYAGRTIVQHELCKNTPFPKEKNPLYIDKNLNRATM